MRFPPSPTGNLHVGNVRSALFNWVFARHYGGTFVLRVEDTDAGRNLEESYRGPLRLPHLAGSDLGRGSRRSAARTARTSSPSGARSTATWSASCSRPGWRTAATAPGRRSRRGRPPGPRARRRATTVSAATSAEQRVAELEAMSAPSVVRMRVPDAEITFDDLVRGPVTFAAAHVPDYVIVRGNGEPLYTLVNPVDDSLMEITHVLRGEDLLPSTPRQIVLYDALGQIGVGSGRTPIFGHLPTVLGEGNRRLSKRDKGSGLAEYQQQGYLPEALLNYLALLGWAIAEDRDIFSHRRDGGGLRHPPGERQPGPVRRQEVRGDQRRAHPAAAAPVS